MNMKQTTSEFSRITRISGAAALIAFSGSALALAEPAPRPAPTDAPAKATRPATPRGEASPGAITIEPTLPRGEKAESFYATVPLLLKRMHPNLRTMTDAQILDLVRERARQIHAEEMGVDLPDPPRAGSGGGALTFDAINDTDYVAGDRRRLTPGPGDWWNGDNVPAMGEGYRTDHTPYYLEDRELNLRRLQLRSMLGGFADYSNLAIADTVADINQGGIWPTLELPSNTQDFDGDGELFDPLPARPVVVYYQFLEENMTDLEWDGGEDNFNLVGLRTSDTNDDDIIDFADEADDTDGISDSWPANPLFVNPSVIPPPDVTDQEADLSLFLSLAGLGTLKWGDDRPIFTHPDAEAAWRLAQREYFAGNIDRFQDSFDSGQVLTEEERQIVLSAMRAIEDVTNITFIERPDLPGSLPPGFTLIPPPNNGYPVNAVGYALDTSGVAVDPGGILGLPGASEFPWQPEDDYPWILIAKGGQPDAGEDGPTGSTVVGRARNLPFPAAVDFGLTDLDGDGFPDTPDTNGDGFPDQIILSADNIGNAFNADPTMVRSVMDSNGDTIVNAADATLTAGGAIDFPPFGNFLFDLNFDGTIDQILDTNGDGDPAVLDFGDLQIDLDGDGAGDSVYPSGTAPSPIPFPTDSVPCELLGLTQAVFDNQDIGATVYQLMRHLGFLNEHQRPDRDDFVRVNYGNIDSDALPGFALVLSGTDKFANFIENFDTTTSTVPPAPPFTPRLPGLWTIAGAPTSGGWGFAAPTAGDAPAPTEDYAVDEDDMSAEALVTGAAPGQRLVGETIFISPNIYGPEDATVNFAYYINSDTPGALQAGDGLIVETSPDGGATWNTLIGLGVPSDQWRVATVTVGEVRNDGATSLPDFQVRFRARNTDAGRVVEMGLDRIRVQNPYDFLSVMHFGTFASSIFPGEAGFESIEVREPNTAEFQDLIGLAQGLSLGDRIALSNLYGDPVVPDGGDAAPDPCRADVDGNGVIDAVDVTLFLELYNAGDLQADFAAPFGVIDIFDLVQFFVDVQNSFRCQNDPDNSFGSNNFSDLTSPG